MKKIYIVMVELPTLANKILCFFTRFKYSHFSVCLDDKLKKLYAFQVRNKKTPLVGGFMEENESYYFHGKNVKLHEMIFEIPVSDKEYREIYNFIKRIKNDKEYIFNYVSALFMLLFGGLEVYKSYFCCDFISDILNIIDDIELPKKSYKMKPKDLYKLLIKYKHTSRIIDSSKYNINVRKEFLKDIKTTSIIKKSFYTISESIYRFIFGKARKNYDYKKTCFYSNDFK